MKTTKLFCSLLITGVFILCISSCSNKNYRMITRINSNGSVLREIYTHGDSAFLAGDQSHNPFLFTIDSGWQMKTINTTDTGKFSGWGKDFNIKISKKFQSVKEASTGLQFDEKLRPFVVPEESMKKEFRWFYTYYTFTGKYKKNISDEIPVSIDKYMSKAEQKTWFQGDLSGYEGMNGMELKGELDGIETHFYTWWARNIYEASFNTIQHIYEKSDDNQHLYSLTEIKDTLFQINSKDIESRDYQPSDICEMLDEYYDTSYFSIFYKVNEHNINELYDQHFIGENEGLYNISIQYELIIPGKILYTNTELIRQDTLIWKVDALRFIADDYVIIAKSHTTNGWAFAVTFLSVMITACCIILKIRMKKKFNS